MPFCGELFTRLEKYVRSHHLNIYIIGPVNGISRQVITAGCA